MCIRDSVEIHPENVGSFHSHGDRDTFPLTALLAQTEDAKGQALLLANYQDNATLQVLKSPKVMAELMGMILRVRDLLDAHHALVATAMGALVALIIGLTRRLRAREMETLTLLGCRKRLQWSMQAAELVIVLGIAFLGAWSLTALTILGASSYFRTLTG